MLEPGSRSARGGRRSGLARVARVTAALATLALGATSCFGPPRPVVPLPSLRYDSGHGKPMTAVVLMPGRGSRAGDFAKEGFVRAVEKLGLDLELLPVDAHLGYYIHEGWRTLPDRIQADVVLPAQARGCRRVWLVGTSLGAWGSVAYAERYPEAVAGILLLGPYLGEEPIVAEIERAGGLAAWSPTRSVGAEYEVDTWRSLKRYTEPGAARLPELFLGYGAHDRYLRSTSLVQAMLPRDHVLVDPRGGHDYATWLGLWEQFLAEHGHQLEGHAD
jgi:pimeloyl-ACP methyl ester carboxylesterase